MADGTLIEFFLNEEMLLTGKRLQRVEAARADLLACFAAHLPSIAPEAAEHLRVQERRSDRPDAAAGAVPPAVILEVLPHFLDDPQWHGTDLQDRVVRARLAWNLAGWVGWRLDLRGSAPYEAVRQAKWRSRKAVRRIKADESFRRLEESGMNLDGFRAFFRDVEARRQREAAASTAT